MINIIKSDFYRVFKSVTIYIAIVIMIIIIGTTILIIEPGYIGSAAPIDFSAKAYENTNYQEVVSQITAEEMRNMDMFDLRNLMKQVKGYELDRDYLGVSLNLYYIFIFVAALAITVDFSGSSIKNTLTSAISRKNYFLSKIIFVNLVCLIFLFANTYIMYFGNILFNTRQFSSDLRTVTVITIMQIPPIMAIVAILTGIAFITKKTAIYNTITIPLVIIFQVVLRLAIVAFHLNENIIYYELQVMLNQLAFEPSGSFIIRAYLLCGGIIVLFYTAGWLSFRKAEIK